MPAKAQITGEFATPNDVASRLRIPADRAADLSRQVVALYQRESAKVGKAAPKDSARRRSKKK
jgi:hypothetical protein